MSDDHRDQLVPAEWGTQSRAAGDAPAAPQPIRQGPRLPQKLKWVTMPDEYGRAGFRIQLWINCPSGLTDDALRASAPVPPNFKDLEEKAKRIDERARAEEDFDDRELDDIDAESRERLTEFRQAQKDADERRLSALGRIVVQHNGWLDENGDPYPPCSDTEAFWRAIPDELASAIMILMRKEQSRLPSSMMRAGRS